MAVGGVCDKRASLPSIIQGGAGTHSSHVGGTWGQGYFKGIECPGWGWSQRKGVEGDNNQGGAVPSNWRGVAQRRDNASEDTAAET